MGKITIITGYFGSGKTEIAINLALQETPLGRVGGVLHGKKGHL